MLNKLLPAILESQFGMIRIANENDPGGYIPPKPKKYTGSSGKKASKDFASMNPWGESYYICCPVCGDTKFKLGICYRWNTTYKPSKGTEVRFSHYLMRCHRGGCNLKPVIDRILSAMPQEYSKDAVDGSVTLKKGNDLSVIMQNINLPLPSYGLLSDKTPQSVVDYVLGRNFDPNTLDTRYGIRYVPKGAIWEHPIPEVAEGEPPAPVKEPFRFWDDRLLIPIHQHRMLIGWQARALKKDAEPKYIFPGGAKKSTWLYNMDRAMFHQDIMITEGVTNVWRVGDDTTALFGHAMSVHQLMLMKTLWGFDGKAIVCMDDDTYPKNTDRMIATVLRMEEAFPRGVAVLRLRGGDCADHERGRIQFLKSLAFQLALIDPQDDDTLAVLDEADIEPGYPEEFAEEEMETHICAPVVEEAEEEAATSQSLDGESFDSDEDYFDDSDMSY